MSRIIGTVLTIIGTYACCAMSIVHFYGLHRTSNLWPFKSMLEKDVMIAQTALIATLVSSWAIWFGTMRKRNLIAVMLRTGLGTQFTLTVYGIAGCGGVLGGDHHSAIGSLLSDVVFPSTLFAEYNFLTFIFQVAPVTAIAAALFLYCSMRWVEFR